jgi:hypothetical protein
MFSHYLETIEGVTSYPLISLLIFIPFFIGVLIYVVRMKKEDADKMSKLPLN